jgi:SsrA-binding protein
MHRKSDINIKNRKAGYEYFLLEVFTAGLQLMGTEIKSIRAGKANLTDAYCAFTDNELFVINMHIAEYDFGSHFNHEAKRPRKLLLNRRELNRLLTKTKEKGFTIIPTRLYINDKGIAKLEIALAKGKHSYDKRESIKQKDQKRDMARYDE